MDLVIPIAVAVVVGGLLLALGLWYRHRGAPVAEPEPEPEVEEEEEEDAEPEPTSDASESDVSLIGVDSRELAKHQPKPGQNGEPLQPTTELQEILGQAFHQKTNSHYLLMRSGSRISVSRLKSGDQHLELFSISQEEEELKLLVVRKTLILCSPKRIVSYKLNGEKIKEIELFIEDVADFTASDRTVYCLQQSGKVSMYSVPELENTGTKIPSLPPDPGTVALCIAYCRSNGRVGILSGAVTEKARTTHSVLEISQRRVVVYDNDWSPLMDPISINGRHVGKPCLALVGDKELILSNRGTCWNFYYVNYASALAAEVNTAHNITDALTAICEKDANHLDVAWLYELERWDLAQIRTKALNAACQRKGLVVDLSTQNLWPRARTLWRVLHDTGYVRVDKQNTSILVMTSSGLVQTYTRCNLRTPCPSVRQLPINKFYKSWADSSASRFDTMNDSDMVVSCGRNVIICYPNGDTKSIRLGGVITDVFYHACKKQIYALMRDRIVVLTDGSRGDIDILKSYAIDSSEGHDGIIPGMVRHEDKVYILINQDNEFAIHQMDLMTIDQLNDDEPKTEMLFPLEGLHMEQIQMAVDGSGRLVVYRRYLLPSGKDTNGAIWNGLEVYSPESRRMVRRIRFPWEQRLRDMTHCPCGGVYVLANTGLRHVKITS